jgi:hypothetical protein
VPEAETHKILIGSKTAKSPAKKGDFIMGFPLLIFLSILTGIVIIISMIFAGFSGNIVFTGAVFLLLCVMCFIFARKAAMRYPKLFWLFGICYILIPLFFALDTIKMRLIWISFVILLYIVSLFGGLKGRALGIK